jgi:hypothetical protein
MWGSLAEKRTGARKESDSAKIYFRVLQRAGMESAGRSRKRANKKKNFFA